MAIQRFTAIKLNSNNSESCNKKAFTIHLRYANILKQHGGIAQLVRALR